MVAFTTVLICFFNSGLIERTDAKKLFPDFDLMAENESSDSSGNKISVGRVPI